MQSAITIVHVLSAVALVAFVLLQHGKGADAGAAFGSGSAGTVFGSRGPASFLTRTTAVLATVFFVTSMSLAYLSGQGIERRSVTERVGSEAGAPQVPSDVPSAPSLGAQTAPGPGDVPVAPVSSSSAGDGEPSREKSGAD